MQAVQDAALLEDLGLGAVQVLRPLPARHHARAEPAHAAAGVAERERDPAAEPVDRPAPALRRDAGLEQQLGRVALGEGGARDAIPVGRREPEPEPRDRLGRDAALGQVDARRLALLRPLQVALVERRDVVEQAVGALGAVEPVAVARRQVLALDLDAVPVGEPLDGLGERQVLDLLHEVEQAALLAAAEALVELVARVDVERRRPLVVERAAQHHLAARRPARAGPRLDQLDQVGPLAHGVDGRLADPSADRVHDWNAHPSGSNSSRYVRSA